MIVFIPLSKILTSFDNTVAAFVGGTFWELQNEDPNAQYFTSDFTAAEEMVDYGLVLCQQVEAEGAALLMNNNNALPLAKDAKVSTFSSSSVNLVYGGTGSGNIDASTADTLRTKKVKESEADAEIAKSVAQPLSSIDKVSIIGGDASGVSGVSGNVPVLMAQTMEAMKESTGIDMRDIVHANSLEAKTDRNITIKTETEGEE